MQKLPVYVVMCFVVFSYELVSLLDTVTCVYLRVAAVALHESKFCVMLSRKLVHIEVCGS